MTRVKKKNKTSKKETAGEMAVSLNLRKQESKKARKQKRPKSLDEILQQKVSRARMKKNITKELLKRKKTERVVRIYSSPYAYVYADYLKGSKYEKSLRAIENRLTDLGISGRIHRLSQFKNLEEIISEDIKRGITTVVAVGDDSVMKKAISVVADLDIVLGLIPLGGENEIASLLGIPEGVPACDTLSQRIIDKLDIGKINNKTFFSRLIVFGQKTPIICDRQYEILSFGGDVFIYNLNLNSENKNISKKINPKDGRFEILVKSKKSLGMKLLGKENIGGESWFFAKKLKMKSSIAFPVYVDEKKDFYKDVDIRVVQKGLRIVVGKGRKV